MIHYNDTAIKATNEGKGYSPHLRLNNYYIGSLKTVSVDGWRSYEKIESANGFELIDSTWVTGNWSDAPAGHSENEVHEQLIQLEKKHKDVYVVFTPTSNVFSTHVDILIENGEKKQRHMKREGKKIDHNTYRIETEKGYKIKLHETDILIFENNHVTLNTNGWQTVTTKDRMNKFLPSGMWITQKQFKWYLNRIGYDMIEYNDGMTVPINLERN